MPHTASTQETKSLQDQELTLPNSLQPKFTNIYNFFTIHLFIYVIPSSNFVSFCFFPFQTFYFHFVLAIFMIMCYHFYEKKDTINPKRRQLTVF